MKNFEVKITLDVYNDGIETTVSKTDTMNIEDALTNYDNEDLGDRLEYLEDDNQDYDEELDVETHNITVKSGDKIKSELEWMISDDLCEYIDEHLYENFGVEGSASVANIEFLDISSNEIRKEVIELSQNHHDEMNRYGDEQVYKVK